MRSSFDVKDQREMDSPSWTVQSKGLSLHSLPLNNMKSSATKPSDNDLNVIFNTNDRSAKQSYFELSE